MLPSGVSILNGCLQSWQGAGLLGHTLPRSRRAVSKLAHRSGGRRPPAHLPVSVGSTIIRRSKAMNARPSGAWYRLFWSAQGNQWQHAAWRQVRGRGADHVSKRKSPRVRLQVCHPCNPCNAGTPAGPLTWAPMSEQLAEFEDVSPVRLLCRRIPSWQPQRCQYATHGCGCTELLKQL